MHHYTFMDYCNKLDISVAFEDNKAEMILDLRKKGVQNPSERGLFEYWCAATQKDWDNFGLLMFCLQKVGMLNDGVNDKEILEFRAKHHLEDCLSHSYDVCDLKEKWYGDKIHSKKRAQLHFCKKCFKEVIACESEMYCARCYRDIMNNWRPV